MARRIADKYTGRYLKVDDLNGRPLALTVTQVADEEVGEERVSKFVLYGRESAKGFVLNVTNAGLISEFLGTDDVDEWTGATVMLVPAKTTYQGRRVPCIRVQAARPARPGATAPSPAPLMDLNDDDEDILPVVS